MKRPLRQRLKGAFLYCTWCGGNGCLFCDEERRQHGERKSQPIFTARTNDPEDMAALRRLLGREALERAFAPGGGGVAELECNAAVESLLQTLRKARTPLESPAKTGAVCGRRRTGRRGPRPRPGLREENGYARIRHTGSVRRLPWPCRPASSGGPGSRSSPARPGRRRTARRNHSR